jgi:CelD/BcsL family acetyltransferase involved in cellulose biosynthesis
MANGDSLVATYSGQPGIDTAVTPEVTARPQAYRVTADITVELAAGDRLAEIQAEWIDLLSRADAPNIFMHPGLVKLAGEAYRGRRCIALLAWQAADDHRRLVGVWAFTVGRAPQSILPMTVLTAPPMPHAYLATPVIDRSLLDTTLEAMLTYIAGNPALPKFIALEAMTAESQTMYALTRVLARRGSAPVVLARSMRPKLASTLDGKKYLEKALSSGSRKKLRQQRRRLAEKGSLEFRVMRDTGTVRDALKQFLALEAAGWKGRQGTALLNSQADATFARAMIEDLALRGEASVHAIYLNGRPVSMQIVLRAGPAAFTWKTAYDESWRDVSPGMLLLEDYTADFLADESIAYVDSCAHDDTSFMAAWSEREAIATVWLDCRAGDSVAFTMLSRLQKAYLALRKTAKHLYLTYTPRRTRPR